MTYAIELHSAFVLMQHLICLQAVLVELPLWNCFQCRSSSPL